VSGHTDAQQQAIEEIDRNLQIIACAGSGKTRVVASRVVHILDKKRSDGIAPENIVAFTFTEKAAAELKDRITRLYQQRFGDVEGLGAMYVGTIHGFCLDLLERYVPEYLKFDVLDEIGQRLFVDRNSVKSGLKGLGLKRWIESNLYVRILGVLREAEIDADRVENEPVADALEAYEGLLEQHRYLDYDGILVTAVAEIASNETLRAELAERVRYLTVDEYQDVNPIQEQLVRQLHDLGANVCVVGDDDQNLYQWRGSDVDNILTFTDRYPIVAKTPPLESNFRSSEAIVKAARRIVEVNTRRLPKAMESRGHQKFERGDLLALTFDDPSAEAEWVATKIEALQGAVDENSAPDVRAQPRMATPAPNVPQPHSTTSRSSRSCTVVPNSAHAWRKRSRIHAASSRVATRVEQKSSCSGTASSRVAVASPSRSTSHRRPRSLRSSGSTA
jgi:ATP-dependent DNA helicase UvrD/PcrA